MGKKKDSFRKQNSARKEIFSMNSSKSDRSVTETRPTNGNQLVYPMSLPDKGFDDDPDELALHPLSKTSFAMKLLFVWDPSRTVDNVVTEGYSGVDAYFDSNETQPWYITGAKRIISSIGGM